MNRDAVKTHYFLALPLPKEVSKLLEKWVKGKKEELFFKTWVVPEDYHITLHFLGDASTEQLHKINQLMLDLAGKWKPFDLEITHFGLFGEAASPRILWVGVREESSLFFLQNEVGSICKQAGFELERRPYSPHITLARKWEGENPFSLPHVSSETMKDDANWKWRAAEIVLYKTHLNRLPKYEAIYQYPFL